MPKKHIRKCPTSDPISFIKDSANYIDLACRQNVCYTTASFIERTLIQHGYIKIESINTDNLWLKIPHMIDEMFQNNECVFLLLGHHGHAFFFEVNGVEKYVRFYQSYGGRFSLAQWITVNPNPTKMSFLHQYKRDRLSDTNYSYDVDKAKRVKAKFGSSIKISGNNLNDFLQKIINIGTATTFNKQQDAYAEIFGVRSPTYYSTGQPINTKLTLRGGITIYSK